MEVFFYGLFMDQAILEKNGVKPSNPRNGYLENFTLKIGNRASLIASENETAYGVLMTVDEQAIKGLYAEASVADYIPELVTVITENGEVVEATCYNLPLELLTGTNASYAASLHQLASQLDFPQDYLDKIKEMSGPTTDEI